MSVLAFWIAAAALFAAAAAWLARPLLRRGAVELAESDQALTIYRDQVAELRRDAAEGLIDAAAGEEAEREIALRAARAARGTDAGLLVSRRRTGAAALWSVAVGTLALGLYLQLGAPGASDQPLAARVAAVERLVAEANAPAAQDDGAPAAEASDDADFAYWWTVAKEAEADGDYATAANAYRRAAAISNDAPAVVSAYAEALTLANGNKVPPPARLAFEQVLAREPMEPRARYYIALAKAQAQDFEAALADWRGLLADSAPDAPWLSLVRRDIANMERFLAKGDEADAAVASGGSQGAATEDWRAAIARARDLAAGGDAEAGRAVLAEAEAKYAGAPFVLRQIAAAREGLATAGGPRGPDDADIAAAAAMSPDEQDEMIRGMVAGLAERLEETPGDVEGWLMLIRSYAVLQDRAAATAAAQSALEAISDRPGARRKILSLAAQFALNVK